MTDQVDRIPSQRYRLRTLMVLRAPVATASLIGPLRVSASVRKSRIRPLVLSLSLIVSSIISLTPLTATATVLSFTTLDDPATVITVAQGINNAGQIVGYSGYGGFLYNAGTYTNIIATNSPTFGQVENTYLNGINDAGKIVGTYADLAGLPHSFVLGGGNFIEINDPLSAFRAYGSVWPGTFASGINNVGQIVGSYVDNNGTHGFAYNGSSYSTIDDPMASGNYNGVAATLAYGINNLGQVVGSYYDNTGGHGFLYSNGTYTTLNYPLTTAGTIARGINDAGQIVGSYVNNGTHSFVYSNGTYTSFDDPSQSSGQSAGTVATGINNAGQIVGYYGDNVGISSFQGAHGFLALGPPPASTTPLNTDNIPTAKNINLPVSALPSPTNIFGTVIAFQSQFGSLLPTSFNTAVSDSTPALAAGNPKSSAAKSASGLENATTILNIGTFVAKPDVGGAILLGLNFAGQAQGVGPLPANSSPESQLSSFLFIVSDLSATAATCGAAVVTLGSAVPADILCGLGIVGSLLTDWVIPHQQILAASDPPDPNYKSVFVLPTSVPLITINTSDFVFNPNNSSRQESARRIARDGRVCGWRLRRGLSGVCGLQREGLFGARCPVTHGGRSMARLASSVQLSR